jgi:hypothetical protein
MEVPICERRYRKHELEGEDVRDAGMVTTNGVHSEHGFLDLGALKFEHLPQNIRNADPIEKVKTKERARR